jgi:hypothetical protein
LRIGWLPMGTIAGNGKVNALLEIGTTMHIFAG